MNQELTTKWNRCLEIIRDNVSRATFDTWFADIRPIKYENNTLTIQVKSNFVYEFLEGNFVDLLRSTLFKVMGNGTQLMYSVLTDKDNNRSVVVGTDNYSSNKGSGNSGNNSPKAMQESIQELDSMLINKYTFDNFVEGVSNRLSRSVAVSVADKPGRAFNPLFIHGASGVGKTHLINAIGMRIKELHPELRVLYVSAHLFQVQYTDSILQKNFNDFMRFYQSIDVLIIDDIQEFAGLQRTQNAFFHIFNHLHLNGKQLIMTSDRSPAQLQGMEERLITRFKWGMLAELEAPDVQLRHDILKRLVRKDGLDIPEDVIEYVAENLQDNVRELEGIVHSMLAWSVVHGSNIDLDFARKILKANTRHRRRTLTIEDIVETVCRHYKVTHEEVYGESRKAEFVLARQLAMYLSQKHTGDTAKHIGHVIGRRTHATVLHGISNIEKKMKENPAFRKEVREIEKKM
jgi:chromosomal replication initiator protein